MIFSVFYLLREAFLASSFSSCHLLAMVRTEFVIMCLLFCPLICMLLVCIADIAGGIRRQQNCIAHCSLSLALSKSVYLMLNYTEHSHERLSKQLLFDSATRKPRLLHGIVIRRTVDCTSQCVRASSLF